MDPLQRIMVVADTPAFTRNLLAWLPPESYQVTAVATFAAATAYLQNQPDLVITQVRLGAYNGLHLALHAQSRGIPAVVVGDSDPVLERDAAQVGAMYLTTARFGREQVLSLTQHLVAPPFGDAPAPDPVHDVSSIEAAGPSACAFD